MTIKGRVYGRNFWRQAAERALKTSAQAVALVVGGDAANVLRVSPGVFASAAVGGFVLSLVTSVATAPVGQPNDPSAVAKTFG
jgi:r1t holin